MFKIFEEGEKKGYLMTITVSVHKDGKSRYTCHG